MTAAVAVSAAMRNDSQAARSSASSLNSEWYQRIEKPVQDVTAGDSLNEKTIRLTMGTYRKKLPSPSARARSVLLGPFICAPAGLFLLLDLVVLEQRQRHQEQHHHAGHRRGHRPVGVVEEFIPHHAAHHQRVGATQHFRDHVFAHRRDEHQHGAGDHALTRQRHGDLPERLPGLGAQVMAASSRRRSIFTSVAYSGRMKNGR